MLNVSMFDIMNLWSNKLCTTSRSPKKKRFRQIEAGCSNRFHYCRPLRPQRLILNVKEPWGTTIHYGLNWMCKGSQLNILISWIKQQMTIKNGCTWLSSTQSRKNDYVKKINTSATVNREHQNSDYTLKSISRCPLINPAIFCEVCVTYRSKTTCMSLS